MNKMKAAVASTGGCFLFHCTTHRIRLANRMRQPIMMLSFSDQQVLEGQQS
jgi:hypothetical protein